MGIIINFSLSDAVSFYLGISALTIAIISLSIADKKRDMIDYFIETWWDKPKVYSHNYNVKFKIINGIIGLTVNAFFKIKNGIININRINK